MNRSKLTEYAAAYRDSGFVIPVLLLTLVSYFALLAWTMTSAAANDMLIIALGGTGIAILVTITVGVMALRMHRWVIPEHADLDALAVALSACLAAAGSGGTLEPGRAELLESAAGSCDSWPDVCSRSRDCRCGGYRDMERHESLRCRDERGASTLLRYAPTVQFAWNARSKPSRLDAVSPAAWYIPQIDSDCGFRRLAMMQSRIVRLLWVQGSATASIGSQFVVPPRFPPKQHLYRLAAHNAFGVKPVLMRLSASFMQAGILLQPVTHARTSAEPPQGGAHSGLLRKPRSG